MTPQDLLAQAAHNVATGNLSLEHEPILWAATLNKLPPDHPAIDRARQHLCNTTGTDTWQNAYTGHDTPTIAALLLLAAQPKEITQ